MFGDHGLCGLLEEGAHEKSPKCLGGNLGDFGEFCKGLRPSENNPLRSAIEAAAQAILDIREKYRADALANDLPPPTLAELYAPDAGYPDLVKAHAALDKAVDKAYSYKKGKNTDDEAERVAFLFDLYRKAIESENTKPPKKSK